MVADWEDWTFSGDVVGNSRVSVLLRLSKGLGVGVVEVSVVYGMICNWWGGMGCGLCWRDILK